MLKALDLEKDNLNDVMVSYPGKKTVFKEFDSH